MRHDLGAYSTTPSPGSVPVKVSREIPLTFLAKGSDKPVMVNHDDDNPCYECVCCALWARAVDQLRAAMIKHEGEFHDIHKPASACLVCELMAGAADG